MNEPNDGSVWFYRLNSLRSTLFWIAKAILLIAALHSLAFVLFDLLPSPEFRLGGLISADRRAAAEFREHLGLTGTAWNRYSRHLLNLLRGDFGRTLSGTPIRNVVALRIQHSTPHVVLALMTVSLVPFPLSLLCFQRRESKILALLYRVADFGWLPAFLAAVIASVVFSTMITPVVPTASGMIRTALLAFCGALLPTATLFSACVETARVIYIQSFVIMYRALGLTDRRITWLLAKNLWLAIKPLTGRILLGVLLGTVFAEVAFDEPGFGRLFAEALRTSDYGLLAAWLTMSGGLVLIVSHWERRQ